MRLFYKAVNFATGKTITGFFIDPDLVKGNMLTFTEIGYGLYYLDIELSKCGPHCGKFFEGGKPTLAHVFRKGEHPGIINYA